MISPFMRLKALVRQLTTSQAVTTRKFIRSFSYEKAQNKSVELFNHLRKSNNSDFPETFDKVGKKGSKEAFNRLTERLLSAVMDSLLIDRSIHKKGRYSELYQAKFWVKKRLMLTAIVKGIGLDQFADYLLHKVILKAQRYELYFELIEAQFEQKWQYSLKGNFIEQERLEKEIAISRMALDGYLKARDLANEYSMSSQLKGHNNKKLQFLKDSLKNLKSIEEQTLSINVRYYRLFLLAEYYRVMDRFQDSIATCNLLIDHIQQYPAICNNNKLAQAWHNQSIYHIYVFDFEVARQNIQKAIDFSIRKGWNYESSLEIKSKIHYYQNQPEEALIAIESLISLSHPDHSPTRFTRLQFYKACFLFVLKEFSACCDSLMQIRHLDRDPEGYNSARRILLIMALIERGHTQIADYQLDCLRKHIARLPPHIDLSEREQVIYVLLNQLSLLSYNFKKLATNSQAELEKLRSISAPHRWEINTHELILFQEWIASKALEKDYRFSVPKYLRN